MVSGGDPVPEYRLRAGARLAHGPLVSWWHQRLVLEGPVLDLLTEEHARMVQAPRRLRVRFERSGRGAAGHAAKAAKGELARHLCQEGGDLWAALTSFEHPEWQMEQRSSTLVVFSAGR